MREIKFRAWDRVSNKMIFADEYWIGKNGWDAVNRTNGVAFTETDHLNGELMQYTGLKDKNGKDIYEGDIVETQDWIGKVWFCDGCFCLNIYVNKTKALSFDIGQSPSLDEFMSGRYTEIEIKGNVYKNPELLQTA